MSSRQRALSKLLGIKQENFLRVLAKQGTYQLGTRFFRVLEDKEADREYKKVFRNVVNDCFSPNELGAFMFDKSEDVYDRGLLLSCNGLEHIIDVDRKTYFIYEVDEYDVH